MPILIIMLAVLTLGNTHYVETKFNNIISKSSKKSYPFPDKSIKNMDAEELKVMIQYAKDINDKELAFKAYFTIFNLLDHVQLKEYKLDLADYCYQLPDYEKAAQKYEEFCILYPGSQESEYAQYKLILCTFYLSLEPDRDQANTIKTINLISLFCKHAKDQKLVTELQKIYTTCRNRLLQHEVLVMETYLHQQKFTGAQQRLEYIKANFLDIEHIEEYIVYLQAMLELVQDPKTRPFLFKLNLENALSTKQKPNVKNSDIKKTVSYFVA